MLTVLLIILLVVVLCGGGYFTLGSRAAGSGWYAPGFGTLVIVLILLWLILGGVR